MAPPVRDNDRIVELGAAGCRPTGGSPLASAMVAAIDNGAAFTKGRDFATWLGLVPKQMSTSGDPWPIQMAHWGSELQKCRVNRKGATCLLLRTEMAATTKGIDKHLLRCDIGRGRKAVSV